MLSDERIAELTSQAMDGLGMQSSRAGHLIEDSIFNAIQRGVEEALEEAACLVEGSALNAYRGGHGEPGRLTGREYAAEIRKLKGPR